MISKVKIENYKCFKEFSIELDKGINILVDDNESGKSTILEAIHLALMGLLNGRNLRNELTHGEKWGREMGREMGEMGRRNGEKWGQIFILTILLINC